MAEQNQTNNQRSFRGPRRGHGPMMGGEKAKDFKGTIGKLFRYIGKYKAAVVVVAIFAIHIAKPPLPVIYVFITSCTFSGHSRMSGHTLSEPERP